MVDRIPKWIGVEHVVDGIPKWIGVGHVVDRIPKWIGLGHVVDGGIPVDRCRTCGGWRNTSG